MNNSGKNLSDAMFNFDFLAADDSDSNEPGDNEHGSVQEFEKCSPETPETNRPAMRVTAESIANPVDKDMLKFDAAMERDATHYFPLSVMREFRIVPALLDSANGVLTVLCQGQPDEELPLKLEALLNCQGPLRIVLQSSNVDTISALIRRIENNAQLFESLQTDANSHPTSQSVSEESADAEDEKQGPGDEVCREQQPATEKPPEITSPLPGVLFVCPAAKLSPHLRFALRAERIEPVVVADCDNALKALVERDIGLALIHDTLRDSCRELELALRKKCEWTPVRFYASEAGLLTGAVHDSRTIELFEKNLHFAAHLADVSEQPLLPHGARVADLCQKLSDACSLPSSLRLALLSAAHWHDIAARDLREPGNYSHSDIIALSASRLDTLGSPPEVTLLLGIMSQPKLEYAEMDSDMIIAGCALAIADHYCHNWATPASLTSEQLCEARNNLQEFSDSLAFPDVANKLLEIIEAEVDERSPQAETFTVHILDMTDGQADSFRTDFKRALADAGFSNVVSHSVSECAQSWISAEPQAIIVLHLGEVQEITDTLFALALGGVAFNNSLTMILTSENVLDQVIWSIKHGVEDVFPLSVNPDILVTKIARAQKRLQELSQARLSALQDMGTHGSLEDMNLITLLEALRDSSRPLRLSVTAEGLQLLVYVNNNCILFATCAELSGIEAISRSVGWNRGIWSIDPVAVAELPRPNLGLSIDAVMLEACVKCDLSTRISAGQ